MKLTRLTRNIRKVLWLSSLMAIGVVGMFANAGESPFADALNLLPDDEKGIKKSKVSDNPLHIASTNIPAYVMIVLGRDHNLFTEAYNDYTALKDEANAPLNIMFDPSIEYYGLFDSDLCYAIEGDNLDVTYDGTKDSKQYFYPVDSVKLYPDKLNRAEWSDSLDKTKTELVEVKVCDDQWSGNFLNYVTTARIDIVRKILYGGTRIRSKEADVIDGVGDNKGVVLKHSNVLADAHSWAKVFSPKMYNNKLQFKHFIGERAPSNAEAIFLGVGSWSDGGDGDPSDYTTYNVERAAFLRYGWVENAGIPGEHSVSNINKTYVWDWASVEQAFGLITDETNKLEKIFINKKAYTKMLHVVVCTKDFPTDESCYNYGTVEAPSWRPIGILQEYEVNPKGKVKFGLITGKWKQNFGYGALRANIGDFSDEVNTDGSFDYTKSSGFVDTLDKFRIARHNNFNGDKQYYDCKRQDIGKDEKISQGACTDWGNPVSKLLYLATQYFINSESVTTNGTSISKDSTIFDTTGDLLDLKYAERKDPYSDDAYYCAKPSTLLIADENITFDGDIYDMNNATITDEVNLIGQYENLLDKSYLMGYSASDASNTYKYLPTSKLIKKLSDVVGLAPSVAQSFGSYNVAGVAKHFSNKDRLTIKGKNNNSKNTSIETYVVAMKPNMPELKIQIDND